MPRLRRCPGGGVRAEVSDAAGGGSRGSCCAPARLGSLPRVPERSASTRPISSATRCDSALEHAAQDEIRSDGQGAKRHDSDGEADQEFRHLSALTRIRAECIHGLQRCTRRNADLSACIEPASVQADLSDPPCSSTVHEFSVLRAGAGAPFSTRRGPDQRHRLRHRAAATESCRPRARAAASSSMAGSTNRPGRSRRSPRTSFRTTRARERRRRSTPKCVCSMTRTRSTSACSRRTISPDEIIINELRKDFNTGNGDSFQVVIDTFKDERNGYQFAVNPAGAKWDAQMSNEGRENNSNWDGVWDVGTRIAEDGLVCGDPHPVSHAEVQPLDAADLGHQLPAASAPAQRKQLLGAAAAHPQPVARVDGRHDRGAAGPPAGQQPPPQAVRAGQLEPRRRRRRTGATSTPASTSNTA